MNRKTDRSGLGFWSEKEMRLEAAHLLDQVDSVHKEGSNQVTPFLNVAMRVWIEDVLHKDRLLYLEEGGFPEAERIRIVMGVNGETLMAADAKISLLWVRSKDRRIGLEHRQILGSLMGLGFERDVFGDIQAGQNGYYLAAETEITPYLLEHWNQAGREKIDVSLFSDLPEIRPELGKICRITLSSLRLDGLISKGYGIPRSDAQELIVHCKVRRNGLVLNKSDIEVRPGDRISVQGFGRIKLLDCTQNRKERMTCQIELFHSRKQ